MIMNHTFTYMACQSCHAKIKCDQCQTQISEMLMRLKGVRSVEINIPKKTLQIVAEIISADEIEDVLEDAGVFVDW